MSYTLNNIKRNNLIALGLPNDADYITYVNDQVNTNHGKLQSIEESFNNENLPAVDSILNNFIDTNSIETNLKLVYSMYLKTQYGDTLSNSDSTYLYDLAFSDPLQNGDAVVSAAVLLDLDIPWTEYNYRSYQSTIDFDLFSKEILIYPNPTKDKLNLCINSNNLSESYTCDLIDFSGKLVFQCIIKNSELKQFDISYLENGVYVMIISNSKANNHYFKIVKQY